MRLDELRGRRVALLGYGDDMRAAFEHLVAVTPSELLLVDDDASRDRSGELEQRVRPPAIVEDSSDLFVRFADEPKEFHVSSVRGAGASRKPGNTSEHPVAVSLQCDV